MESLLLNKSISIGKAALLLSMSSRENEKKIINYLKNLGFLCGITEIGGISNDVARKINNSTIAMGCSLDILRKECSDDIHAAVHAIIEASNGLFLHVPVNMSYSLKIALVRKDKWLSVAVYGYSAAHKLTNHERAGLGIMHIEPISKKRFIK